MKLKDFITQFADNNAMFRVLIKCTAEQDGNHMVVSNDWNTVSMCHAITNGYSIFNNYADKEVLYLTSVYTQGHYPESLNVVVEGNETGNLVSKEECDILLFEYRHGSVTPNECVLNK